MNVAINCRNLIKGKLEGFGNYSLELIQRICKDNPEYTFLLLFDRPYDSSFIFSENCKPIIVSPPTRHPFLNIFWAKFSLPRALRKYKADLFWSPDGICSTKSSIPQVITIHDINFEHYPKDTPKLVGWYYRKFYPLFAQNAEHILTVSEFSKKDLIRTYGIENKKISVIHNGVSEIFKPSNDAERSDCRSKYTNGKKYFVFVGSIHPRKNIQRLVMAFEQFYQKNNTFQLLIVGSNMWGDKKLVIPNSISNAVGFTGHVELEALSKIMAGAFAFVYPPYFEGFGIPLIEAMKSGVPVLSSNKTCLPEVAGDAALFFDPFNVNDIAEKLEIISKDELLRETLIKRGYKKSQDYNWDKAAKQTWQTLEKFIKAP